VSKCAFEAHFSIFGTIIRRNVGANGEAAGRRSRSFIVNLGHDAFLLNRYAFMSVAQQDLGYGYG
jgi:hypothetical protein